MERTQPDGKGTTIGTTQDNRKHIVHRSGTGPLELVLELHRGSELLLLQDELTVSECRALSTAAGAGAEEFAEAFDATVSFADSMPRKADNVAGFRQVFLDLRACFLNT